MVRIGLPNRLKSYSSNGKTSLSAAGSRATSPSGVRELRNGSSPALILKTTVVKVHLCCNLEVGPEADTIQARNLAAKDRSGTSDPVGLLSKHGKTANTF